jgi:hypothetical protein
VLAFDTVGLGTARAVHVKGKMVGPANASDRNRQPML